MSPIATQGHRVSAMIRANDSMPQAASCFMLPCQIVAGALRPLGAPSSRSRASRCG